MPTPISKFSPPPKFVFYVCGPFSVLYIGSCVPFFIDSTYKWYHMISVILSDWLHSVWQSLGPFICLYVLRTVKKCYQESRKLTHEGKRNPKTYSLFSLSEVEERRILRDRWVKYGYLKGRKTWDFIHWHNAHQTIVDLPHTTGADRNTWMGHDKVKKTALEATCISTIRGTSNH